MIKLETPLNNDKINKLNAGDVVLITGTMYIARDAAHKKMIDLLNNNLELPFDINNQIIYYAGPAPEKHNQIINSVGPTSSYRMDSFMEELQKKGLKGTIGKGPRSDEVREGLVKYNSIYFVAVGGAAALIAKTIVEQEVIAFEELGAEALRKIKVVDFPCIVGYDSKRNSILK